MNNDFTKEDLTVLFTCLQVVIRVSPILDWGELEPKLKEYGVNVYESLYGHYITDTQPDNIDRERFAKTLAKVFKQLGKFMEDEGAVWKDSQRKLDEFMQQDRQVTHEEASALFMKLKEEWAKYK